MDLWNRTNWFVVYTKPYQEELAAMNIKRLPLEVFLPKIKRQMLVAGTPQIATKPLFPHYLFSRFCPSSYLHRVRYARGVRYVIGSGDNPIPVNDEIIQAMRSRIGEDGSIQIDQQPLRPGDRVKVEEGPLEGLLGVFEREMADRERVVVLLQAIEYQARVLIEKRYLKAEP